MADQRHIIAQQNKAIGENSKTIEQLQKYARNVLQELQRVNGQLAHFQNTDYRRHQVTQSVEFAINSLPFWKRSPKNIMERSRKFFADITAETNQLVEADTILYLAELEAKKKDESNQESENPA